MTAITNPELWWARYSPQLWLIPIIVLTAVCLFNNKKLIILQYLLSTLLLVNIIMVSSAYLGGNYFQTHETREILENLSKNRAPIFVYYGTLDATTTILKQYKIQYNTVETIGELPCPKELAPAVFYSLLDCTTE